MPSITRKCSICKVNIEIDSSNEDFFIISKGKEKKQYLYTHTKCYIDKETTKKRNPKTIEECEKYITECKNEISKIEKKLSIKNELYNYLLDTYNISFAPKYFFVKMDSVFKGTFTGLNKPVPPEHLLEMWRKKQRYLDTVAERNRVKGKEIDGLNRVNYDLAILLSRYDSYLEWKEQQKIAMVEAEEQKKRNIDSVSYLDIARQSKTNSKTESVDIGSILDEI